MKYHNIPTLFDNQASLINGKNIGTDSVRYIQDAGQKTAGTTYIDKNTNELYVCVTTTNSVNNDSNFSKFNLKEAFNKLDSLKDYFKIEKVKLIYNNISDDYVNEMIYETTIYKDNYPNYELITANLSQDISDVSSESIAAIFRYQNKNFWNVKVSATGKSHQMEPWIWVELIFMKIIN